MVSQKFYNILVHASLQHMNFMIKAVQVMKVTCCGDSIVVVAALTYYALLHSMWFESHTDEYVTLFN